jgi:hypothetical protein
MFIYVLYLNLILYSYIMNKNNYNYILNGITHEIPLNSNIKIRVDPINEEQLISNKFMIKFIVDLFDYHNIDYFLLGDALLGFKIFNGINLFSNKIELGIIKNNLIKLQKLEQYLIDNDFNIFYFEHFIIIKSIFFNEMNIYAIIYLLENDKKLFLKNEKNDFIFFDFYQIFPLNKVAFEEFTVYVPNKIDDVLNSYNINYNNIIFNKITECDFDKLICIQEKIENNQKEQISYTKKCNNNNNHNINVKKIQIINILDEIENDNDIDNGDDIYVNNDQEVLNLDNMINNIINKNMHEYNQENFLLDNQIVFLDNIDDNIDNNENNNIDNCENNIKKNVEINNINDNINDNINNNIFEEVELPNIDINETPNLELYNINEMNLNQQKTNIYKPEIYISILLVIIIIYDYQLQLQFHE